MKNTIYIMIRNDDPGPLSNPVKERRVLEMFERHKVPQVLAVIPKNVEDPHVWHSGGYHSLEENPDIIELLKEYCEKGLVEIAQHGCTHQTNRLRPSSKDELNEERYFPGIDRKWTYIQPAHPLGYSEFSGLPYEEQEDKVLTGKRILSKIFKREFSSFIFPWNTYDKASLKTIKKNGYMFVPAEDDVYVNTGVCVIGCCYWDWEIDRIRQVLKEAEDLKKPILIQFAYHSCFISEETLAELETFLAEYSSKDNIVFITPSQIPKKIPWAPGIIRLRSRMLVLERAISQYTDDKIETPKYYSNDAKYYVGKILRYLMVLSLVKVLSFCKCHLFVRMIKNRLLNASCQSNLIEI